MADKESSVLFSLQELMNLEKSRVLEEERDKQRRLEAEARARLEAEQRAREAEESRLRAEEERRRNEEMRRRLEDAQIEAAKEAEIERRRLAERHELEMAALARQREHEKELEAIAAARPKGVPRSILAAVGVAMLAAAAAIVFLAFVQPVNAAKEAVQRAQVAAASDDPKQWVQAYSQLAIAKEKDPKNPDIAAVEATLKGKRDALAAKQKAESDANDAKIKAAQEEIDKLQKQLAASKDAAEQKLLKDKIDGLKPKATPTPGPVTPKTNCKEVPGCPLCPKVCN